MKTRDVILAPTRTVLMIGLKMTDFWESENYAKLMTLTDAQEKSYALVIKRGVKIALDIDFDISNDSLLRHDRNEKELYFAMKAGMTPLQAIEACTSTALETLSPQAPLSGQVKEEYDADLIVMNENPLENIDLFSDSNSIKHVSKAGKLVKSSL